MSAPELTVYTTPTCGPCIGAKKNLDSNEIPYATVDLTQAPDVLASLKERLQLPKVNTPLFEWRGELKGLHELREIIAEAKATGPAS